MSRRTLVIGLGSTGSEMVDTLLRELHAIDGSLDSFPHVHAVKIDTAKVSPRYVYCNQVHVIQLHEHIVPHSNLTWEGYLSRKQFMASDWLTLQSCSQLRDLDFSNGAVNNRHVGQFAIVMTARFITDQLLHVIRYLRLVTEVTSQELTIFVVGFSGGGTCSGGLVTLLEAVQHAVTSANELAKVHVLLSIPHINFKPLTSDQRVFVPNTVGLLQTLTDARSLPSYGSLASTYQVGLLPNGTRSLVLNEKFNRLAHMVSIIQPANVTDTSSVTQSVVDAVMAQILGVSDVIGDALVNQATQTNQLNIFTTKRATYPRQEIVEGLLATALDQALVLWTGSPGASANVVGIVDNILKVNDDGKHFGDIAGMIRIAVDSVVQDYRLRFQSDDIRIGRASDYQIFVYNVSAIIGDFSNALDLMSVDTTEPAKKVITELLCRLREAMMKYPEVGYSNLLRQSVIAIEQTMRHSDPTMTGNGISTSKIEEVATDLSMQLNPVYRQSSYTAVAYDYLSQVTDELGNRAIEHLLNLGDFSRRFRIQLKKSLSMLRNHLDNRLTYDSVGNLTLQDVTVGTIVSQLQSWSSLANNVYSSLVRQQPNVFNIVDEKSLLAMREDITATDLQKSTVLNQLLVNLTEPKRFGVDELNQVVEAIVHMNLPVYLDVAKSMMPQNVKTGILSNVGQTRAMEVPFSPTDQTTYLTFRFTNNPTRWNDVSIPTTAESVIELTFATDIPLDNLLAFTLSNTWADALKGIRGDSPDYDRYRTIYPSNQLGLSEAVKAVSQFPDTRQNDGPDSNSQDPENRDTHRISSTTSIAAEKSIFISYRREDSRDTVGRMYDRLSAQYGVARVIRDIDSLPIGRSFPEALDEAVSKAAITLVIIGPNWASICDDSGVSRLENSEDFVRREVVRAMASGKPVVPVLVSEAKMPKRQDIPEPLHKLLDQHGIHVRPDPDFHKDMDSLIRSLNRILI